MFCTTATSALHPPRIANPERQRVIAAKHKAERAANQKAANEFYAQEAQRAQQNHEEQLAAMKQEQQEQEKLAAEFKSQDPKNHRIVVDSNGVYYKLRNLNDPEYHSSLSLPRKYNAQQSAVPAVPAVPALLPITPIPALQANEAGLEQQARQYLPQSQMGYSNAAMNDIGSQQGVGGGGGGGAAAHASSVPLSKDNQLPIYIGMNNEAKLTYKQVSKNTSIEFSKEYGKILECGGYWRHIASNVQHFGIFEHKLNGSDIVVQNTGQETWLVPQIPSQGVDYPSWWWSRLIEEKKYCSRMTGDELWVHPTKRVGALNYDWSFHGSTSDYAKFMSKYDTGQQEHTPQSTQSKQTRKSPRSQQTKQGASSKTQQAKQAKQAKQAAPAHGKQRVSDTNLHTGMSSYTRKKWRDQFSDKLTLPSHNTKAKNYGLQVKTRYPDIFYCGTSVKMFNTAFYVQNCPSQVTGMLLIEIRGLNGQPYNFIPVPSGAANTSRKYPSGYEWHESYEGGGYARANKIGRGIAKQYGDSALVSFENFKLIIKNHDTRAINKLLTHDFLDDKDSIRSNVKNIIAFVKYDIKEFDNLGKDWYAINVQNVYHQLSLLVHSNFETMYDPVAHEKGTTTFKVSFKMENPMVQVSGGYDHPKGCLDLDTAKELNSMCGIKLCFYFFLVLFVVFVFVVSGAY